jgi:hypothetical protein
MISSDSGRYSECIQSYKSYNRTYIASSYGFYLFIFIYQADLSASNDLNKVRKEIGK